MMARAWLSYVMLRLGPTGAAGLLLLAASSALLAWQALDTSPQRLLQRVAAARAELQRAPAVRPVVRSAQTFVADLPPAEQVPDFIEGVHRAAFAAGLQIDRVEYRAPTLAAGQVLRSQMVLPVSGSYPAIAQWLAQVQHDHPSAAIDELTLQRDAPAGEPLHGRVVLSHYSRNAP
ncbi:type 4a pilus biogenesis protein PilO [Rhizobacter sp. P5_C2]